MTLIFHLSNHG